MLKTLYLILGLTAIAAGQTTQPTPLFNTYIPGITATYIIDNRSIINRNLLYVSLACSGSGSWSVELQYGATSTGSWTSYGGSAILNQDTSPPTASGFQISAPNFIRVLFNSGTATCSFSGFKNFYPPVGTTSSGVATFNTRSGAVVPQSGDYLASQVTNAFDKIANNALGAHYATFTDISTPALPSFGDTRTYTKSGKFCSVDPAGNENCTGGGASTQSVSSSGTPAFAGGFGVAKTFNITLNNDVASCTASGFVAGQVVTLRLTQDGTGNRLFACSAFQDLEPVFGTIFSTSVQVFTAVSSSALIASTHMICEACSPGISIPSGGGVNFITVLPTAGGTQTMTSATGQVPVITGTPGNGECTQINKSSTVYSITGTGSVCGAGGGAYTSRKPNTASIPLSGDTVVYTFSSVPALAAGSCYIISALITIPLNAAIKIAVDGTVIAIPISGLGAGANFAYTFSMQYCNNPSVQNVQNMSSFRNGCYYFVATPGVSSTCNGYDSDPTVIANVDLSTSHTFTILVNGTGNTVGLNASIL